MKKTVLVVDDDQVVVEVIETALLREGWSVQTAADGVACMTLVASCKPDLIILDLVMPEMDGLEVLERLRQDPLTRLLPVIILTGRKDQRTKVNSLLSGAERFLEKPILMDALLAEVRRFVSTSVEGATRHDSGVQDPRD